MTNEEKIASLREFLTASQSAFANAKLNLDTDGNIIAENNGTVFSFDKNTKEYITGFYNNKGEFTELKGNAKNPYSEGGKFPVCRTKIT